MDYSITSYPLVIDPVTNAIELHVAGGSKSGWRQFVRVHPDGNHDLPFTPTPGKAHLFGDAATIPTCQLLMVYDNRGGVQCLLSRHPKAGWEHYDIPEEFSGYTVRPSLRTVFNSREACGRTMQVLDELVAASRRGDDLLPAATELAGLLRETELTFTDVFARKA